MARAFLPELRDSSLYIGFHSTHLYYPFICQYSPSFSIQIFFFLFLLAFSIDYLSLFQPTALLYVQESLYSTPKLFQHETVCCLRRFPYPCGSRCPGPAPQLHCKSALHPDPVYTQAIKTQSNLYGGCVDGLPCKPL